MVQSSLLSYSLVGSGLLVILIFGGVALLKRDTPWGVVAAVAMGAFLIAAPLIQTFHVDQTGVSIETVGKAVIAAGDTAAKNADALLGMQRAIADVKKQVDDLAEQQRVIVTNINQHAASGTPAAIDTKPNATILQRQTDLQKILQSNDVALKDLSIANTANKSALQNAAKSLGMKF